MADKLGELINHETQQQVGEYGPYYRVRVSLDISQPLKPYLLIRKGDEDDKKIGVKYEHLSIYYYFYGVLGHKVKRM